VRESSTQSRVLRLESDESRSQVLLLLTGFPFPPPEIAPSTLLWCFETVCNETRLEFDSDSPATRVILNFLSDSLNSQLHLPSSHSVHRGSLLRQYLTRNGTRVAIP
jgi:hypothetical protein